MSTYRSYDELPHCPHCSSERVISNALMEDTGKHSLRVLHALVGYGDPDAWALKDPVRVPLRADICCNCGAVDLKASGDLDALWERYESLPEQE